MYRSIGRRDLSVRSYELVTLTRGTPWAETVTRSSPFRRS